ncbi:MAG: DUF2341 domain-containing protein [Planctomycetes bacterium]|nr:DUF2341 domain-containing protein [Planctomycetota bacterium]
MLPKTCISLNPLLRGVRGVLSSVFLLSSLIFPLSVSAGSFPNFDNSGGGSWTTGYYRPISITNTAGAQTDYQVAVTPFGPEYEENNGNVTYNGTWNVYNNVNCSRGSQKWSTTTNNTATFSFNGTGVTWVSTKNADYGIAKVYIDDVYQQNVDLYNSTNIFQQAVYTKDGLANGFHTIKVEVTGTKNASSTNYYVTIDAFDTGNFINNSGLVGSWHFSENSGTAAADMSGNGNNGTLTNSPIWVDGKFGNALSFDGANDYVSVSDNNALTFGNGTTDSPFSIELWVYPNSASGAVIAKATASNAGEYYITTAGGNLYFRLVDNSASGYIGIYAVISQNRWTHITAAYDGNGISGMRLYFNGVLQATTASSSGSYTAMENLATNLKIGERESGSNYFNGLIDEVRIYNRALTAAEITTRYNYYTNKLTGDYSDIRFALSPPPNSGNELSYWQETDNKFWLKIPNLPAGDSYIYMYYGNLSAENSSDENNVFGSATSNLALGKTYTKSEAPSGSYPDTGNAEFTDGQPDETWADSFGYGKPSTNYWLEITVDLTYSKLIKNPILYTGGGTGYRAHYVEIYGSPDNTAFYLIGSAGNLNLGTADIGISPLDITTTPRVFRYVKFKINKECGTSVQATDWLFVGEGIVNGKSRQYVSPEPTVSAPGAESFALDKYIQTANWQSLVSSGKSIVMGQSIAQVSFTAVFTGTDSAGKTAKWKKLRIDKGVGAYAGSACPDSKIEVQIWMENNGNGFWDTGDTFIAKGNFTNGTCYLNMNRFQITTTQRTFYIVYKLANDIGGGQRAGVKIVDSSYLEFENATAIGVP